MKARIPLQAKVKKQVREEVAAEWQKIQKEKSVAGIEELEAEQ